MNEPRAIRLNGQYKEGQIPFREKEEGRELTLVIFHPWKANSIGEEDEERPKRREGKLDTLRFAFTNLDEGRRRCERDGILLQ